MMCIGMRIISMRLYVRNPSKKKLNFFSQTLLVIVEIVVIAF